MATEVASPRHLMPITPDLQDDTLTDVLDDAPSTDASPALDIPVSFAGQTHVFHLPADAVLDDLTIACEDFWDKDQRGETTDSSGTSDTIYDWSAHKFIAPPPVGLLKGADDHDRPLAPLLESLVQNPKIRRRPVTLRLVAARASAVQSLRAAEASARRRQERRLAIRTRQRIIRPTPTITPYTFAQLRVLPLSHPDRSMAFLERLRDDVGVRSVMRAHRFTVGLLTEMDPAAHTTASHEGMTRTLGLNRNQGQVIELRLRTDSGDGYRDYRTVRRTLCHELAHNVHSSHDAQFWALCHALEHEVERADYHRSGRTLAGGEQASADYYAPIRNEAEQAHDDENDDTDAGGWTGGSFVLGTGARSAAGATSSSHADRREMARAAEERLRRLAKERRENGNRGSGRDNNGGSNNGGPSA